MTCQAVSCLSVCMHTSTCDSRTKGARSAYDNDCLLFGPFSPVLFVTLLMYFIELTAFMKKREIVMLIVGSRYRTA